MCFLKQVSARRLFEAPSRVLDAFPEALQGRGDQILYEEPLLWERQGPCRASVCG